MTLTYAPTATGTLASSLTIVSDDPDEGSIVVPISGSGIVTMLLNNGAATTTSNKITINSAVLGATKMRFSNDGVTWPGWSTYNTSKAWTLPAGSGTKTVYGQYQIPVRPGHHASATPSRPSASAILPERCF